MDFPDLRSLKNAAQVHKFRDINDGESEDDYRNALADHVQPRDFVESCEIRNKVGWNKFSESQNQDLVRRSFQRHKGR